jgi:hypothetical protein
MSPRDQRLESELLHVLETIQTGGPSLEMVRVIGGFSARVKAVNLSTATVFVDRALLGAAILSAANLFDDPPRNRVASIPQLLRRFAHREAYPTKLNGGLRRPAEILAVDEATLSGLTNRQLGSRAIAHFTAIFSEPTFSQRVGRVKEARDKYLAHPEKRKAEFRDDDLQQLFDVAYSFCEVMFPVFVGTILHSLRNTERIARMEWLHALERMCEPPGYSGTDVYPEIETTDLEE